MIGVDIAAADADPLDAEERLAWADIRLWNVPIFYRAGRGKDGLSHGSLLRSSRYARDGFWKGRWEPCLAPPGCAGPRMEVHPDAAARPALDFGGGAP